MIKNIKVQVIYDKAKILTKELDDAYKAGYKNFEEWQNAIANLKTSLRDFDKNIEKYNNSSNKNYDIIDRFEDINEYIEIVKFGREFQLKFMKLYKIIYKSIKDYPELKDKYDKSLNNIINQWIAFSRDYTEFIDNTAKECMNIAKDLKNKNNKNAINEMAEETINNTTQLIQPTYDYTTAINTIKQLGPNADPNQVNQIINNINSLSGRIGARIYRGFDIVGDYINKGIDYFGELIGNLISKISTAYDNFAYCFEIIKDKGLDQFFNDARCMSTLSYTIIYSTMFYFGLKILRAIFRKISYFTGWLGGRSEVDNNNNE